LSNANTRISFKQTNFSIFGLDSFADFELKTVLEHPTEIKITAGAIAWT
jgi:hypothetical protein